MRQLMAEEDDIAHNLVVSLRLQILMVIRATNFYSVSNQSILNPSEVFASGNDHNAI